MIRLPAGQWAVILGGSSGFGLAAARKLADCGLDVCIVHRDARRTLKLAQPTFDALEAQCPRFLRFNVDAMSADGRQQALDALAEAGGGVRVVLHSIANGNLRPIAPHSDRPEEETATDDDFAYTIHAMGTSLFSWVKALHAQGLFAADARILGLTSEGSSKAWRGYAAVAAAKSSLESVARAIAMEFAPHGLRANIIQAGATETPAMKAIPGHEALAADCLRRNPFGRMTTPEDVANVIALLASDEAAWINGAFIHADGGEHLG